MGPGMKQQDLFFDSAVKVLVPVSGGKDSQSCLKLALENYPASEVRGLFCDTKFEHPLTYQHIEDMKKRYGVRIDTVNAGTVEEKIFKYERFPSDQARFCTEELKIWPTKRYCKALAEEQGSRIQSKKRGIQASVSGGFEVWYGMRSDESPQRTKRYAGKVGEDVYPPHEVLGKYPKYLQKLGVSFRLAVIEWSESDVFDYLAGEEHPLYKIKLPNGKRKFGRIGCFPCQAAGDKAKETAYQHDEFGAAQLTKITFISAKIGRSQWNSKGGKERNEGCALCSI
jgi:3'-phosphoadenosine 5'-phosphosulfate sulfotransferase (PAPS reductase)/FAD synthetase